jgi:undecaprenyl-diphosphatase
MSASLDLGSALLLGALQGLTEFLPISSSGHLAIAEWLLGVKEESLAIVMLVHAGTLLALCIVFRPQLEELVRGTLALPRCVGRPPAEWPASARAAGLAILATIPGVVAGLLFEDAIEASFGRIDHIGWQFIVTGLLLLATRWARPGDHEVRWSDALWIGVAQAVSILPAISRSGATIAAALFLGVSRPKAGEFSFVISIPIIFGAVLLKVPDLGGAAFDGELVPLTAAFLASFLVGWASLVWLLGVIRRGRIHWFAIYCFAAGVLTILAA